MAVRELSPARCTSASPLVLARRTKLFALSEMRWAALALGLFSAGLLTQLCGAPQWVRWALFLACYATGGWEPGLAGLQALQRRTLDVDLLMVVAAIGAAAIGQIAEGALLIVIFATSGALEALVTARTADSVRGLMGLAPGTATRVGAGGGEETVNAADLRIGDIVLVRPGERISADATVLAGGSEVDQATVTGEPLPVDKSIGDQVFAGTVNGTGALRIRVDRLARDSVVARIATLVEQASQTKARTQLFIEKVEQRYSIGMVAVTLAVFAVPPLWGETLQRALLRAMTFMIVASPCAVVLATMPPLLAAIANAGRHGVLAKSAIVMEQLGTTTRIAFDKTGTLTRGTPELAGIWVYERRFTDDELLRLAAAAEYPSEHPLGAAIVKAAQSRRIRLPTVGEFTAHPGCRVTARVDGHVIAVGSATALLGTAGAAALEASMITAVDFLQGEGYTVVVVVCDSHPVGLLAITDQLRPEAAAAISAATKLTGAKPVLLTGDNRATADRLGVQVGIDDVRAGLLPDDKVAAVRQLQAGGARLTVVGDGINDAPALAAAHVGIAMGSARSELTLQTADAVVVRDDLATIPTVIAMSRRARRIVVANLIVAVTFIAGLVVWDLAFTLPLPLGVARHEGSTIIVGLNGLRLLRHTAWRRAAGTAHR
ncbi:heavy metal translocating P-type ATPase [Mycobacterium tuberculosis]|uniref:heavy metal translocating P-type ATPase n=1 Tax=Mycobacterium tuberculosis TaxID=1773 RepID=UPI0008A9473C|nr:heavy metal translocating P-type ATPase [Mycobacterium tuberculosis]